MLRFLSLSLIFIILLSNSLAGATDPLSIKTEIDEIAAQYSFDDVQCGLLIQDLDTGQVVYAKNEDLLLNPASNTKILTTLTALSLLGPRFTFKTQFLGIPGTDRSTLKILVLRGFGDPLFSTDRLDAMARQLKEQGIRKVEQVLIDGSYFDGESFPGQMDGRQHDAGFNCSVGAISLDHNLLEVLVTPAEKAGRLAKVEIYPPLPSFPMKEEVVTGKRRGRVIVKNDGQTEEDLTLSVKGTIGIGEGPKGFKVSIHHPLQLAGLRVLEALRVQGIQSPAQFRISSAPVKSKMLVESQSPPLTEVLQEINKNSDNFMAEQLTKALGAQSMGAPGTTEKGVRVILKRLKELGIQMEGVDLENGSGLSKRNRVKTQTLAQALKKAYEDPQLREYFLTSLSVMGVDGTLKRRFRRSDLAGRFLGKTGTLNGVSSLSGYIYPKNSERNHPYIFSFIVNGQGKNFWKEKELSQILLEMLLNQ